MHLTEIYRHPVKGLKAESLQAARLSPGKGLPCDRAFAITHGRSRFDPESPQWVSRGNFVVLAHSPGLNRLAVKFNDESARLTIAEGRNVLAEFTAGQSPLPAIDLAGYASPLQAGPYQLVSVPGVSLTDSPDQAVSIMSHASLRSLSSIRHRSLSALRFRGNLWIDGAAPWAEFDWIGSEIGIGETRLRITGRIARCPAINADPDTGARNLDLLGPMADRFGHNDFGVLAEVLEGGAVSTGMPVS